MKARSRFVLPLREGGHLDYGAFDSAPLTRGQRSSESKRFSRLKTLFCLKLQIAYSEGDLY